MANITFLGRLPFAKNYFVTSSNKVNRNISRLANESASLTEIIDYVVRISSEQEHQFIWLLQYIRHIDEDTLKRDLIIAALTKYNIPFIDTFDALHRNTSYLPEELWSVIIPH